MSHKFITTLEKDIIYCALLDKENNLIELHPEQINKNSIIGNIYIGKVSNIIKGIGAIFIDIGLENDVFLQIQKNQHYIYTNNKPSTELPKPGDELLVQITKDSYKTKAASVTSMINLTGRYCVLTYKKNFIGISSKINDLHERNRLKKIFHQKRNENYGFIVRTNAEKVSEEDLISECNILISTFNKLLELGRYRTSFQCIYKEHENYIRLIRDLYKDRINTYLFDDEHLYNNAIEYFNNEFYENISDKFKLKIKPEYNLFTKFGLKSKIEKALNEKVWLKSGANLIIQSTEALYVIDVNTSKSVSKKNFEDTVFATNIEAAKEIARQIRLRNLSGIIIVDFIDMNSEEHKTRLLSSLEELFLADRIKTTLVDMTALGLVEITRKKIDRNLYEKMREII